MFYNNDNYGSIYNIFVNSPYNYSNNESSVPPIYWSYWIDDAGDFITTDSGDNIIFD